MPQKEPTVRCLERGPFGWGEAMRVRGPGEGPFLKRSGQQHEFGMRRSAFNRTSVQGITPLEWLIAAVVGYAILLLLLGLVIWIRGLPRQVLRPEASAEEERRH